MTDKISSAAVAMMQNAALQMDPAKLAAPAKDGGENDFQKLLEKKSRPAKPVDQDTDETGAEETAPVVKRKRALLREAVKIQGQETVQIGQFDMIQPGVIPTLLPVRPKMETMGAGEAVQMLSVENVTEGELVTDEFAQMGAVQVLQSPVQGQLQQEQPQTEEAQPQMEEDVQPQQEAAVQTHETRPEEAPVEKQPAQEVRHIEKEVRTGEEPEAEIAEAEQAPRPVFERVEAAPVKVGDTYRAEDSRQVDQPDVAGQIDSRLGQALERGDSYVRIQLDPESLGQVTVEISRSADGALRVALAAHSSETRNLLERHSGDLQGLLSSRTQQNVQVEVQRQQESQQGQNQHPYDGHNGHAQEQSGQQHQRRQERSSQDFIQQLRLGLIPMEDDED